ncbi:hypothetical protein HDU79_006080 [Rhizoclosmatium sp. JEL0117]|nr:hypothetical protein HDU79_006080 [Rhizoclosmatium sp. JEL0117]
MPKLEELSITQEEQMRLIEETGIMNKLRAKEAAQASTMGPTSEKPTKPKYLFDSDEDGFDSGSEDDDDDDDDDDDAASTARKPLVDLSPSPTPSDSDANDDLVFTTILLTIPLTLLHTCLEYVIHVQYALETKYTISYVATHVPPFFIALFIVIYTTSKLKAHFLMQIGFAISAAAAGVYLIKVSAPEEHEPFGVMIQMAGVAVIWIYSVIQSRLAYSICGVGVPFFYYYIQQQRVKAVQGDSKFAL